MGWGRSASLTEVKRTTERLHALTSLNVWIYRTLVPATFLADFARSRPTDGHERNEDNQATPSSCTVPKEDSSTPAQVAFLLFFFLSAGLGAGGGVTSFLPFLPFLSFSGDDLAAAAAFGVSLTGVEARLSPVLRLLADFGGEGALTGSGDDSDSVSSSTTTSGSSSSSSSISSSGTGTAAIDVSVCAIPSASSSFGTGLPAL